MGKKMKLPFLSKINIATSTTTTNFTSTDYSRSSNPSWPWPAYCQQPKTLSFRTENMFKTLNSAYLEASLVDAVDNNNNNNNTATTTTNNESNYFTNSSTSESAASFSTASDESSKGECIETVIKGLRSERLFFKPEETSSILEEANKNNIIKKNKKETEEGDGGSDESFITFKESVVLSMDSQDPFVDFKKSMEEMVDAHGLKDWESLEELLCCYLKVNGKGNHGYIIGAFVDLLVGLAFAASSSSPSSSSSSSNITSSSTTTIATTTTTSDQSYCSCSYSPSSPLSFYTSSNFSDDSSSTPCVSSLEIEEVVSCLSSSLQLAENDIKEY